MLFRSLWHGANWTFVIWGALHGTYLVFATITENIRGKLGSAIGLARLPWLNEAWQRAVTFGLVCFAWIFFRANNLGDAMYVAGHLGFSPKALFDPAAWGAAISATGLGKSDLLVAIFSIAAMELVHGLEQRSTITSFLADRPVLMRWSIYSTILIALVFFGAYYTSSQFIYFQF